MGKRGPVGKQPERRQGHGARSKAVVQLVPGLVEEHPAPRGLLKITLGDWDELWASPVSNAVTEADMPVVRRLFEYRDELTRSLRAFRRLRLVEGSRGQPRLNPLADQIARLEGMVHRLESELGLTPLARARLGTALVDAQSSLDEINRSIEAEEAPDPRLQRKNADG